MVLFGNQNLNFDIQFKNKIYFKFKMNNKLADPYTEEEIIKFENENNLKIPINLRSYLINVSRETVTYYPYTIELSIFEEYLDIYGNETMKHSMEAKNYFMQINDKGCTSSEFLCVKGYFYNHIYMQINSNCDFGINKSITFEQCIN